MSNKAYEEWCESGGGYAFSGLSANQLAKEAWNGAIRKAMDTIYVRYQGQRAVDAIKELLVD